MFTRIPPNHSTAQRTFCACTCLSFSSSLSYCTVQTTPTHVQKHSIYLASSQFFFCIANLKFLSDPNTAFVSLLLQNGSVSTKFIRLHGFNYLDFLKPDSLCITAVINAITADDDNPLLLTLHPYNIYACLVLYTLFTKAFEQTWFVTLNI